MKIIKRILITILAILFIGYAFLSWNLSSRILAPDSSLEKSISRIEEKWGSTIEKTIITVASTR